MEIVKKILAILALSVSLFANVTAANEGFDTTAWLQIFSGIVMVIILHVVAYFRLIKKKPVSTSNKGYEK